jgi:OOP family OmpA-OmpF porin
MDERSARPPAPLVSDDPIDRAAPEAADFDELRDAIIGPERRQMAALRARLDDTELRARDIGEVLPHVLLQHAQDPHFTRALTPPLEKALTEAVRRDPRPMSDALFPVMGPAIRKAVAASLASMVDGFNRAIEHSFSWRSIQWRLEARRTGRTFGEVVLLKTLVYRVEQVFLIDRRTGLLLQHVQHGTAEVADADMVSGMLTAIRDFVHDSFKTADADSLESMKVGELSVWIEAGPLAIIAAVIRGTAPRTYRQTLVDAVEELHLRFGEALQNYNGDASALEEGRSVLEACLDSQYRADEKKPSTRGAWLVVAAVAIALIVWAGFAYRTHLRRERYLAALQAEPGLVVLEAGGSWGRYVVTGLRDPLAHDPATLIAGTGLSANDVVGHWSPYQSLDASLVLARATALLHPPAGMTLTLAQGVLGVTGDAPVAWVADAARLAPALGGISRFDAIGALASPARDTIGRIAVTPVLFLKGAAEPAEDQADALAKLTAAVRALEAMGAAADATFTVTVIGHTDADGPPEQNQPLSEARAAAVRTRLVAAAGPHVTIVTSGVGSREPVATGQTEVDNQQNRRVTIQATGPVAR